MFGVPHILVMQDIGRTATNPVCLISQFKLQFPAFQNGQPFHFHLVKHTMTNKYRIFPKINSNLINFQVFQSKRCSLLYVSVDMLWKVTDSTSLVNVWGECTHPSLLFKIFQDSNCFIINRIYRVYILLSFRYNV